MKIVKIWVDGSYRPLLEKAGVGVVCHYPEEKCIKFGEPIPFVSSTYSEVYAVLVALKTVPDNSKIILHTDSMLVWRNLRYLENVNNYQAHYELWLDIIEEVQRFRSVKVRKVKSHGRNQMHNICDKLAYSCMTSSDTLIGWENFDV